MKKEKSKKPRSYVKTKQGIVVQDDRQLTKGSITPNVVIDLFLPILGFEGLGVLVVLIRMADLLGVPDFKLENLAKCGGIGFKTLKTYLDGLETYKFIQVIKPEGADRAKHELTKIRVFDPPKTIPAELIDLVKSFMVVPWMLGEEENSELLTDSSESPGELSVNSSMELSTDSSMELLSDSSMGLLSDSSMELSTDSPIHHGHVPIVPMMNVPTPKVPILARRRRAKGGEDKSSVKNRKKKSIYSVEQWVEFLQFEIAAGRGKRIDDVVAVAKARHASDEMDWQLRAWLERGGNNGNGNAPDPRLTLIIEDLRKTHYGEDDYGAEDLLFDLRSRCKYAGLAWDEEEARALINGPSEERGGA